MTMLRYQDWVAIELSQSSSRRNLREQYWNGEQAVKKNWDQQKVKGILSGLGITPVRTVFLRKTMERKESAKSDVNYMAISKVLSSLLFSKIGGKISSENSYG